jgi:predicted DCC family thiol-disulfide oxidoreductase YuxK
MKTQLQAPIWLFDGVCILCSGAVHYVLKHEHAQEIRFVAIQSDEGMALARQHGIDPENPDSFLFIENNTAFAKSDGVLTLINYVNGPARLLRLGKILPHGLRDWLYDHIARNRYKIFGQSAHCMVPNKNNRHRFSLPD